MFWLAVVGVSCLKLLLIPTYRSTDFEVHRNWLAITHSLPLDQWYVDKTSEWTLDYPPLFAWWEWLLAKIARFFDPAMLSVTNLGYASPMTVLFQRLSVIVSDLVFVYGCKICGEEAGKAGFLGGFGGNSVSRKTGPATPATSLGVAVGVVCLTNAGLLLVDHIHFQYNGFLFGILFISIARILQRREIEAAFWFSVLLNLKHIFLYLAPAYFIYLLRSYVLHGSSSSSSSSSSHHRLASSASSFSSILSQLFRLVKLGIVVVAVFGVSFGPFIQRGQMMQVLYRLFPFKRGLSHAFWAPNFWALYNFVDKLLLLVGKRLNWRVALEAGGGGGGGGGGVASMTGGLVQEYSHTILPSVPPIATLILTGLSLLPSLVVLWRTPNSPWQFVRALVLCAFSSFMFGWHVHEKAILMVLLPLGLVCTQRKAEAQVFWFLSVVGHFSLLPLFFTPEEMPIKVLVVLTHALFTRHVLKEQWGVQSLCSAVETLYFLGLIPLFLLLEVGVERVERMVEVAAGVGLEGKVEGLPFLPLMLVSVYCALGVVYSWLRVLCGFVTGHHKGKRKVN